MTYQKPIEKLEEKLEEHDQSIGKLKTKVSLLENNMEHFSSNCLLVQESFSKKIDSLEKKIENGFKDAIKDAVIEAVKESMPTQIIQKKGLDFSDKVLVALIQVIGVIVSSYLAYKAGVQANVGLILGLL